MPPAADPEYRAFLFDLVVKQCNANTSAVHRLTERLEVVEQGLATALALLRVYETLLGMPPHAATVLSPPESPMAAPDDVPRDLTAALFPEDAASVGTYTLSAQRHEALVRALLAALEKLPRAPGGPDVPTS